MKTSIIVCLFFYTNLIHGQDYKKSDSLVKKASLFYGIGKYEQSAALYELGFEVLGGLAYPNDRYFAARAFALSGDSSKAFFHLFSLANGGYKYKYPDYLDNDSTFVSLKSSEMWDSLLSIVTYNKYDAEKDFDYELIAILDTVLQEDQKYRMEISGLKEEFGWESPEMKSHLKTMREKDSLNLIIVQRILDERGWLGTNVVGEDGNGALFLVIQHANTEIQVKYLPLMRKAVAEGNAYSADLALLEDRVALALGEKQIYGSQMGYDEASDTYYVEQIKDPENVDARRKEIGLKPLADYVISWEIVWDIEKHKSRTAKN